HRRDDPVEDRQQLHVFGGAIHAKPHIDSSSRAYPERRFAPMRSRGHSRVERDQVTPEVVPPAGTSDPSSPLGLDAAPARQPCTGDGCLRLILAQSLSALSGYSSSATDGHTSRSLYSFISWASLAVALGSMFASPFPAFHAACQMAARYRAPRAMTVMVSS